MSLAGKYWNGASILKDWLGEGGLPVHAGLSASRAAVCEICPKNQHPRWWEKAAEEAAETIRIYLEVKHSLNLSVPREEDLHMCVVCKCCTRLKVHTPLNHILAHTAPETLAALPDHCWIKTEPTPEP